MRHVSKRFGVKQGYIHATIERKEDLRWLDNPKRFVSYFCLSRTFHESSDSRKLCHDLNFLIVYSLALSGNVNIYTNQLFYGTLCETYNFDLLEDTGYR